MSPYIRVGAQQLIRDYVSKSDKSFTSLSLLDALGSQLKKHNIRNVLQYMMRNKELDVISTAHTNPIIYVKSVRFNYTYVPPKTPVKRPQEEQTRKHKKLEGVLLLQDIVLENSKRRKGYTT